MNILLIGEYSRLHNSLKEGLIALGHQVTLVGNGDGFKKYPVDINLKAKITNKFYILRKTRYLLYYLFKYDISWVEIYVRFFIHKQSFKNYDAVQLINEFPFETNPTIERHLLKFIFSHNNNVFLSACGEDYLCVKHLLSDELKYHILSPYLEDNSLQNHYQYSLKYISSPFKRLHNFVYNNIKGVIPTDMDYVPALEGQELAKNLIPNPINTDKIAFTPNIIKEKIIIFHGINTANILKKGNRFFSEALSLLQKKYNDRIDIITAESLPYAEYIKYYQSAHILLDQVYSHDQGYNALEAMAMGKVVFTGAEECFKKHFSLDDTAIIAMNATPNTLDIYNKLEYLILHPNEIIKIGKNARAFIEKEHHYKKVAQLYLNTWNSIKK